MPDKKDIHSEAITFTKMHGIGNDYIYINCMESEPDRLPALAREMSDRHFGVGGDGIVLICPPTVTGAHFRMRMFNNDGSEARMCGNASRCIAAYLHNHRISTLNPINLETLSGIKVLTLNKEGDSVESVTVDMGAPILDPARIPVLSDDAGMIEKPVEVLGYSVIATAVSMGNPHCVIFMRERGELDFDRFGPAIERHPAFPDRVNVEFVTPSPDGSFDIRVWERGTGETLACGTGACASAVAAVLTGRAQRGKHLIMHLRGGDLDVCWEEDCDGGHVMMTGPAEEVFTGTYFRKSQTR